VGGPVRDLFLGLPVRDLDVAYEGDAAELARDLGERLGASVRLHGRFGTATLAGPDGDRIDIAATRRETYDRPGALPHVRPAGIEEDLARRDFTVNAMALEIAPRLPGELLDPFGGREDLTRRRLRILHAGSFRDDPTRAYRAARYANRLGFSVEASTRREAAAAAEAGAFDRISAERRRREIELLLSEPRRAGAVRWLARLELVRTLSAALDARPRTLARLSGAESLLAGAGRPTIWILYVLIWASELDSEQMLRLADRLALRGRQGRVLRAWPATRARLNRLPPRPSPSAFASLALSEDEAAAAAICAPRSDVRLAARRRLSRPLPALAIGGADLIRAGVPSGPGIGRALAATLAARMDGKISPEQELSFALEAARKCSRDR
jgi:tRNA nucleotidyltransferase (CCA-adding enzyme)